MKCIRHRCQVALGILVMAVLRPGGASDDELGAAQAAPGQRPQELDPERLDLAVAGHQAANTAGGLVGVTIVAADGDVVDVENRARLAPQIEQLGGGCRHGAWLGLFDGSDSNTLTIPDSTTKTDVSAGVYQLSLVLDGPA